MIIITNYNINVYTNLEKTEKIAYNLLNLKGVVNIDKLHIDIDDEPHWLIFHNICT